MNGLTTVNVELTSRCNKECFCCGRRKLEKEYPELCNWGDMPIEMAYNISKQIPSGLVVQFHNNGEPLLYPHVGIALGFFKHTIRCFNTNGKLLLEKADEIIGNLETLTISVIQDDPEGDEQYEIVREFVEFKNNRKPIMAYRMLGNIEQSDRWEKLGGITTSRILHDPMGSFDYEKDTTKPEIGICLDLLNHCAINRHGDVSNCVRFDTQGQGILGNIKDNTLNDIWNGPARVKKINQHLAGKREGLCATCDYWGIPRG